MIDPAFKLVQRDDAARNDRKKHYLFKKIEVLCIYTTKIISQVFFDLKINLKKE